MEAKRYIHKNTIIVEGDASLSIPYKLKRQNLNIVDLNSNMYNSN